MLAPTRKTSSFPDSRSPGLYTTWTLSNSSVSSQGSISEGDPRQNRPFKSVFVPTAIVSPVRSTASPGTVGQGSLRKSGRSSMRKSKWWQRGTCLELSEGGTGLWGRQSAFCKNKILARKQASVKGVFHSQIMTGITGRSQTNLRSLPWVTPHLCTEWLG